MTSSALSSFTTNSLWLLSKQCVLFPTVFVPTSIVLVEFLVAPDSRRLVPVEQTFSPQWEVLLVMSVLWCECVSCLCVLCANEWMSCLSDDIWCDEKCLSWCGLVDDCIEWWRWCRCWMCRWKADVVIVAIPNVLFCVSYFCSMLCAHPLCLWLGVGMGIWIVVYVVVDRALCVSILCVVSGWPLIPLSAWF